MSLLKIVSRLHTASFGSVVHSRFWARRFPRQLVAITALAALSACAGGDAPTAPPSKPVTPPPVQNPDAPPPAPTLGALAVEIANAPAGVEPRVVVKATGVQRIVRRSATVDSLPPGDYQVIAEPVDVDSVLWEGEPATQMVSVRAGQAAPKVTVRFRPVTASIVISSTGLPSYARSTVRITSTSGFEGTALTGDTISSLGAGQYTLIAEAVETTDGRFEATPSTVNVTLAARTVGTAQFTFGRAKAKLTIAVDGLPGGTLAGINVTGPNGFSGRADASRVFEGLEPGVYRATAARVSAGGYSYDPDVTSRDASISGTQQRTLAFSYRLSTGAIAVLVGGLPSGTNANITVTGPAGYSRSVTSTQTLTDLTPGSYRVTANSVSANGVSYTAAPTSIDVTVAASMVAVPAEIQYGGAVGALELEISGLPPTLGALVKITRPNGSVVWVEETQTLEGLAPGQYLVEAQSVKSSGGQSWDPDVTSRQQQVKAKETTRTGVNYSPRTGALAISVVGLPSGAAAAIRVTGTSFDQAVTTSTTLQGLQPGTYTVTVSPVTIGGTQYTSSPTTSTVSVTRGNTATKTVSYGGQSTSLTIDFSGLPGGTTPDTRVTGPSGFTRDITGPTVLENLTPGTYRIVSSRVNSSIASYDATPASVDVALTSGERETRLITYAISTGSIAISVAGLPAGTNANISVTGPNSYFKTVTNTETLLGLAPGTYSVSASSVTSGSTSYAASPSLRTVSVIASVVAVGAPVNYGTASGNVRVTMSGLPAPTAGAATLSGPAGASISLSQSSLVGNLAVGSWVVTGNSVTVNGDRWAATPATRSISVASNDTVDAPLTFARVSGHLAVTVSGLPSGTSADVTVTGPNGYNRVLNGSQTLVGLDAGTYTISADAVAVGSTNYAPSSASQTVSVAAGASAARTVSYTGATTSLVVNVSGVPTGGQAAITVSGPNGFSQNVTSSTTLSAPSAGTYTVSASRIVVGNYGYNATPASQSVALAAGESKSASLAYSVGSGALTVTVSGLPTGVNAPVTVTGPNGFSRAVASSQTLTDLSAGTYTIAAATTTSGATSFTPASASQSIAVTNGSTAVRGVVYSSSTTALTIDVSGVPSGVNAAITVTGPSSFSRVVTASTTLTELAVGTYTITSASVTNSGISYTPTPATQTVSLTAGSQASRTVAYAATSATLAVSISGVPSGASAAITVTGPSSYSKSVTSSQTLTGLAAGTYSVSAASISAGGYLYAATPASTSVALSAGEAESHAVAYAASTGRLTVTVSGLPSGTNAPITVTGPSGFSQSVTSTSTLGNLAPGTYTVASTNVTSGSTLYSPSSASQTVSVAAGATASRAVSYSSAGTSLAVTIGGLPTGTNASVLVTGPSGFSQTLTATGTLNGLAAGTYTIAANAVSNGGYSYGGTPASQTVNVTVGGNFAATVTYAVATGRLTVTSSGLPAGNNAAITVTGPNNYSQTVIATTTLQNLAPGMYTVAAANVTIGSTLYKPSAASQSVSISAGNTGSRSVTYAANATTLAVTVNGVPSGSAGAVTVTGPNSFSQTLTATTTLSDLAAGTYTIAASNISANGFTFAATPASQTKSVTLGTASTASVTYAATSGRLTVNVNGLPSGTNGAVTVTRTGFSQTVTSTTTLSNLTPGTYTVAAANVTASGTLYTPSSASQTVSVTAGVTGSSAVTYSAAATTLAVTISGVPSGSTGSVLVTGPNSFSQTLTATTTLNSLAAGTYTITANNLSNGGYTYAGTPASQTKSVTVGSASTASVAYAATTGRLTVTTSGLPSGTNSAISVTGPNSFSQNVTSTTTLSNLAPGTYTVAAANVSASGSTYAPSSASQTASVTAGTTVSRTVSYSVSGGGGGGGGSGTNLMIEGAHVTQAIQNFAGTVPLVAGREALLRVFVKASAANTLQPTVRVRLYTGSTNFRTFTINAPSTAVPTTISEGTLNSSWNATLSTSDMRAGLRILVDVDPTSAISESDENDNAWPSSGTQALDVRTVAPFDVVFVPVRQSVNGLTGNVNTGNLESNFVSMTRRIFPLAQINASVRSTYTTNAAVLQSSDGNGAWLTILSEMNSLRVADGSSANYYGVVNTSYSSGIAGYAYVPGKAGVGWDKSGSVARVTAHELGHNFSRRHVAACGSGNTDANYPHASGYIGNFGWNSTTNSIVSNTTTDIMGYCSTQWISDYTWSAVMNYRGTGSMMAGFVSGPQTTLMVWGRIKNGVVTLEPAFRLNTTPVVATRPGNYRLELRDEAGRVLTGFTFDPDDVDHDGSAQAFAFAVPMDGTIESRLASVAIVGGSNGTTEQVARIALAAMGGDPANAPIVIKADDGRTDVTDPSATVTSSGSEKRITWDDTNWPIAMVRDAQTGQVLSYLRSSGNAFVTNRSSVRVVFSNGVQSVTRSLNVP